MNGHPIREEDFDLYALGALEGGEKGAFESHVASCNECAAKLAVAHSRIAMLAFAAPRVEPSPAVKQRLLAQIRADRQGAAPISAQREPKVRLSIGGWWSAVLAPAAVVLAIVTIFSWRQTRELDRQLAALRTTVHQQEQQLQEAREISNLMTSHDTVTVDLAQQPGMPAGAARVMFNLKMGDVMYEGQIASAPAAKSYQLWLVPASGKPISMQVFNPAQGQQDHWMMKLPAGVSPKAFAITLEPSGGMPQPTGPKVLVGGVS